MENVKENVAYLQGLTKGLRMNEETPEGRIIVKMLDVLEDMADNVDQVRSMQNELEDYIVAVDGDLTDLEENVYVDGASCSDDLIEMQCPVCHKDVSFAAAILDSHDDVEVTCPYCSHVVYDNITDGDCVYEVNDEGFRHNDDPGI